MTESMTSDRRTNLIIELLENNSTYEEAKRLLNERGFRDLRLLDPIELPVYYVLARNEVLPQEEQYTYKDFQNLLNKVGYQNRRNSERVGREGDTEVRLGTFVKYVSSNSVSDDSNRLRTNTKRASNLIKQEITCEYLSGLKEEEFITLYNENRSRFRDYQRSVSYYVSKYVLMFLESQLKQFRNIVSESLRNIEHVGDAISLISDDKADHSLSSLDFFISRSPFPWSVSYIEDDELSECLVEDSLIEYFCKRVSLIGAPVEEYKVPDFFPRNGGIQYFSSLRDLGRKDCDRLANTTTEDYYAYKIGWNKVYDYLFSMLDIDHEYFTEEELEKPDNIASTAKANFILKILDGDKEIGRPNLVFFLCAVKAALFESEKESAESFDAANDTDEILEIMRHNPVLTKGRVDYILDQCSYHILDKEDIFDSHAIDLLEIGYEDYEKDSENTINRLKECVETLKRDMFDLKNLPIPLINNLQISSLGANSTVIRNAIRDGKKRDVIQKN